MRIRAFAIVATVLAGCAGSPEKINVDGLRTKAKAGDPIAMFSLGVRYDNGRDVLHDRKEASKWYLRAAEAGVPEAQNSIGSMYQAGEGVEKDLGKAFSWFQKAANQGHLEATHNLAYLYDEGGGIPENNGKAIELYRKAAGMGFITSMLNLGIMYGQGDGVPVNNVEAYQWLDLARFYTRSSKDIQLKWRIRGALDELKKKMSPADIAAAENLSRDWDTARRKN